VVVVVMYMFAWEWNCNYRPGNNNILPGHDHECREGI